MLNIKQVVERTSYSRQTIYRKVKNGEFPKQAKLGARHVAWPEHEITAWLEQRLAERNEAGEEVCGR